MLLLQNSHCSDHPDWMMMFPSGNDSETKPLSFGSLDTETFGSPTKKKLGSGGGKAFGSFVAGLALLTLHTLAAGYMAAMMWNQLATTLFGREPITFVLGVVIAAAGHALRSVFGGELPTSANKGYFIQLLAMAMIVGVMYAHRLLEATPVITFIP